MCVLCGEMLSVLHWSDAHFKEESSVIVAGENQRERMRLRLKKVAIINDILEFYGLNLKDWQGSKYLLSNKKGGFVIVNDLGDLWIKASELEGFSLDAIDENLLDFLNTKNAS
ncbi:hypothetical protein LS70_000535 [Helicobacter sp. MIT 11-5569]|uniref:hypothetical protein n=1 Tax=Helicobacter sp. MIT 11-5569 TaxID=1548151 RepID=UPI00051FDB81|nr:hypothetical protein [Helicobacter sp. MIT 11-5569]TLD85076.1 hypothetical protein LS70_000535 [Helicobacter sp. MIT 11-5569]